jgi:hypothetical protein
MTVNWKKTLIFLVILLVCSITPVSAEQTGETYGYSQLLDDIKNIFVELDKTRDTELTPEQAQYLDDHQDGVKLHGESMLHNVQEYLNYLIKECNRYENPTITVSRKRSNVDMYTTDLNNMEDYLKHGELNGMPLNISIETLNLDYSQLVHKITPLDNSKPLIDKSKVIVQIRDNGYCVRYMKLVDMNDYNIHLKSGNQPLDKGVGEFNNVNVWNNKDNLNSDRKFNIIVVPGNYSTDYVLRLLWDKQNANLIEKESYVGAGSTVLTSIMGSAGIAVATAGMYRLVDMCRHGDEGAKRAEDVVEASAQDVAQDVAAAAEVAPAQQQEAEQRSLMTSIGSFTYYGSVQRELEQPNPKKINKKVIVTACTVLVGILVAVGSAITIFYITRTNGYYKADHTNLDNYKPPLVK